MGPKNKIKYLIILFAALLLISGSVHAVDQPDQDQNTTSMETPDVSSLELAKIIPLASELSGRQAALENSVRKLVDLPGLEESYKIIGENLVASADKFQVLKDNKNFSYNGLSDIREEIRQHKRSFDNISRPLSHAINQLEMHRKEWTGEKKLWNEWRLTVYEEGLGLDQLKSTFNKALYAIDKILDLVSLELEKTLSLQKEVSHLKTEMTVIVAELDELMLGERREVLLTETPPLFSRPFLSQFTKTGLWSEIKKGIAGITWPGNGLFLRHGWIILFQLLLSIIVISSILRKKQFFDESSRWRFFLLRPVSSGLFIGFMATVIIYEYEGTPAAWKLVNLFIGGISFARFSCSIFKTPWKKQLVYGLVSVFIITKLMDILSFPLPFFRLYTVLAAVTGLYFCLKWAKDLKLEEEKKFYLVLFRFGTLFFTVIIIAELFGKKVLATYLFVSFLHSITLVMVFILFMYIISSVVEWLYQISPLNLTGQSHSAKPDPLASRISIFINFYICSLILLPAILMIWGVYDNLEDATNQLMVIGFNLGEQRVNLGLVLTAGGIFYGTFMLSEILQRLLTDEIIIKRRVAKGVRHAMGKLIHYIIIIIGFLLSLSILGFEITKLTIMLSALGIGIGFGLQNIVNNFMCGLILLFERPVRVGDTIELGGKWAEVKRIGLRATVVQTADQADVIIPNADLISNQVTNWTLTNRRVRLTIPVGVAYGSNIPLVIETLAECPGEYEKVAKLPLPQVLFLSFGASSLDFELRVWVTDSDHRLSVQSDLHQEIDRRFRENNIEIAFPQRDIHIRTMTNSNTVGPSITETSEAN